MANIHVVSYGEMWAVKREGTDGPLSIHLTQERAVVAGRAHARVDKVEFLLHGRHGTIRYPRDFRGNRPDLIG